MHSHTDNIIATYKNYYQVMGLASSATANEISKAFRSLALKWHPDRHHKYQKPMAHRKFIGIMEAYEVLGNPERRDQYDVYRHHHHFPRPCSHSGYAEPAPAGMEQRKTARPKTDPVFEFHQKFEKELHKWRKKAGRHAGDLAKKSYMHFAVSLEIVSKLVVQGIFHTIDLIAGKTQDKKALNEYRTRLEQTPDDSIAHYRMGFLYHQNGAHDEAAKCYLNSLKLNPKDADVFCNLGRLREEQNKYARAVNCYEKAVGLNPDLYVVYAYLGILHLKMHHFIDAKKCFDYLIEAGRNDLANQIERSFIPSR